MIKRMQKDWSGEIDSVIRSRHYTWLAMGLGGQSVKDAVTSLTTDLMHLCRRKGISWEEVLEEGTRQFEREESELHGH